MNLIVDCREQGIISLLNDKNIPHSVESLDLGDMCVRGEDGCIFALFERKTIQDLLSSISDGRYEEQSFRLQECGLEKNKIFYIIEGNIEKYIGKGKGLYSRSTVHSCLFSLTYVKGFSLLCANSIHHTCELLEKFYMKIKSEPPSLSGAPPKTYLDSLKVKKKGNLTDEMVGVMMLAQIPKVSKAVAEELLGRHDNSLKKLISALESEPECLDKMSIPIANNKTRKISKPCVENIKKYLLNVE
jgi:ERCC4-type nuclease